MEFKDLLIVEYHQFWEAVGDGLLLENGFFSHEKLNNHLQNHIFHPKNANDEYDYNKLYRGSDTISRYVFPPTMTQKEYIDRANDLMNDTTDPDIVGFVDSWFGKVLPGKDIYIKRRPCDYKVNNKYANRGNNGQKREIDIPHDEYVAYQINDKGERKLLSYGLVDDRHWASITRNDFDGDTPKEALPASELMRDRPRSPEETAPAQNIPSVEVWYIDTAARDVVSARMSRKVAQDSYASQWLDNGKNKSDKLIFKIEGCLEYPPKNKKKRDYWVEREDEYDVDLSGECTQKVAQILKGHQIEPTPDVISKFIKVYKMRKLRKATSEKMEKNYQAVMLGVSDFDNMKMLQGDISEGYHYVRLPRQYLAEANRQQLLQKSRNAQHYKDISKGRNRYERRMKSRISATVRDYNNIQMDSLFKRDMMEIKIPVMGETDVYEVDVRVEGLLKEVHRQVMSNKGKLEFKVILQSLMKVLNVGNVYIGCSCPDAKYRMAYWQTKNNYKAGYRETRPSDVTNRNDTLGAGCKHVMLILANLDWCVKVASVVNNYIKYCQTHLEQLYADYIFPKIYGIQYGKAVQMSLFYDGVLPSDRKTMDDVVRQGMVGKDKMGRFVKDNPYALRKRELSEPEEDDRQLKLNLDEPKEKELDAERGV